ncbi:MAG: shikimate kinase [Balneolaceae bacterium]
MEKLTLKKPLFLCGMMGSGKSTIGQILAEKLHVPFHDLDEMIEDEAGISIPEIFERDGEQRFRKLERNVLIRESQKIKGVMALGGGSLQHQRIIDHLKIYGWLVFLDVDQSVLLKRLQGDSGRPMLKQNDEDGTADQNFQKLLQERRPLYEQAEITIQASRQTPAELADSIINKLLIYDAIYSN